MGAKGEKKPTIEQNKTQEKLVGLRLPDRWIWDSWYVWDGDTCHVFYLCASRGLYDPIRRHRNTNVGHAISKDLINWEVLPDALSPSESPAFDSWTTWTGSCVRAEDGRWWMFYTGTSREDAGLVQTIGAAVSDDLIVWKKLGDKPLVEADPNHYEKLTDGTWHDEAWRDPWVFQFPGDKTWHMLVTARAKHGDPKQRGVLGHAISEDLKKWKVLEPLSEPGQGFGHLEVFQFEVVDGVPILLFCCGWRELSEDRLESFGKRDATYSVVVDEKLKSVDFNGARAFEQDLVYAGRLIKNPAGEWFLIGFVNEVDGEFVGQLSDPIPVTSHPILGLVPRD